MFRIKKIALAFLTVVILSGGLFSCPYRISLRAYLDRRFWQPFTQFFQEISIELRAREPKLLPFAGFASHGPEPFQKAQNAYALISQPAYGDLTDKDSRAESIFNEIQKSIRQAQQAQGLTASMKDELDLLLAKVEMRRGEADDQEALIRARNQFQEFITTSRTQVFRSEARGWLARTQYLLGDRAAAAKIYLDEFKDPRSNLDRQSLENSLQMLFHDGGYRLGEQLPEYFDTPGHALFAVYLATNPIYKRRDPELLRSKGRQILDLLKKNHELFQNGDDSDRLALASMRVSLYMGELDQLLGFARQVPTESKVRKQTEFNWLLAAGLFLKRQYEETEKPLLQLLQSPDCTPYAKGKALIALIGIYEKLSLPVKQLHAAVQMEKLRNRHLSESSPLNPFSPFADYAFDLRYLLDAQLTIDDLEEYLKIHPNTLPLIRYSLAVRYAREEQYDKAAEFFSSIKANTRSSRMREAGRHFEKHQAPGLSKEERLHELFPYAVFLAENSGRVFFNNHLWGGFQTSAFLPETTEPPDEGDWSLPQIDWFGQNREERVACLKRERDLKDAQEEYWRAYQLFKQIWEESGDASLRRKSALAAIHCLDRIHRGRFGRIQELNAATNELVNWLKKMPKLAANATPDIGNNS